MVVASPSRSGIVGAHPSWVRARVISGRRTFGSSVGSGRAVIEEGDPAIPDLERVLQVTRLSPRVDADELQRLLPFLAEQPTEGKAQVGGSAGGIEDADRRVACHQIGELRRQERDHVIDL